MDARFEVGFDPFGKLGNDFSIVHIAVATAVTGNDARVAQFFRQARGVGTEIPETLAQHRHRGVEVALDFLGLAVVAGTVGGDDQFAVLEFEEVVAIRVFGRRLLRSEARVGVVVGVIDLFVDLHRVDNAVDTVFGGRHADNPVGALNRMLAHNGLANRKAADAGGHVRGEVVVRADDVNNQPLGAVTLCHSKFLVKEEGEEKQKAQKIELS